MPEPVAQKRVARWHLHRRLYDWVLHWAHTRYGTPALAILAFAESSFFPVPPDVLLIALVLGRREKAWRFATICSVLSVLGGVCGYGLGAFAWRAGGDEFFFKHIPGFDRDSAVIRGAETTGLVGTQKAEEPVSFTPRGSQPVTLSPDEAKTLKVGSYTKIRWAYQKYDFWVVWTAGFTPIPYKLITITSGVFEISFPVFLLASATSRSARFFLVAGLIWWAGPTMKRWVEKYFNLFTLGVLALLVVGILAIKYLF